MVFVMTLLQLCRGGVENFLSVFHSQDFLRSFVLVVTIQAILDAFEE